MAASSLALGRLHPHEMRNAVLEGAPSLELVGWCSGLHHCASRTV